MVTTVDAIKVQTYESYLRHLAQQGVARLRPWCMEVSEQSEGHNWDRMAATTAIKKTTRKTPTPDQNTAVSRRKSIPVVYQNGDTSEKADIAQIIVDINSNLVQAQGKSMARAQDDEVIEAAVGPSRDGNGNSIAFDANQIVGDGTTSITFDMVTEVTEKFMANDIDPDEQKVFVIGPKQARKLLQLTEATSGDYNALKPLTSKGYVESWMGYTWLLSTRLLAPAGGELDCFAMTRKAMGLQMNYDVWARVTEDPTISYAWRIYCEGSWGAIRVEDEHLVKVHVADTV